MMRTNLMMLCATLALAACSKPAAPAGNASAAPAGAASAPATPAAAGTADQLPAPTAGLWTRVSVQDVAAPETGTKCMDGKPIDLSEGGPPCANATITRTATGGYVYDGTCGGGGQSAKLHGTFEGDFKTNFTTDITAEISGGPGGAMTTKNHSVYTFKSATCPAGS